MPKSKKNFRISEVLLELGINAAQLSRESGVDRTLISRWQNGERKLSRRSRQLDPVVKALLRIDTEGRLSPLIAPYGKEGLSDYAALCDYLCDTQLPALNPQAHMPDRQKSGEYIKETRIFLGKKGFRRAALAMLDYLMVLPPGREVVVVCQGRYEWITKDLPFVMQFIAKLRKAITRDTRLLVINRRGYSLADTAAFAGPWLLAHLHGYIRSLYFDGELPKDLRFVASINGFWSGHVEEDVEVEDELFIEMYTDPRDTRKDEQLCYEYIEKAQKASQYAFLENPQGDSENIKLWHDGALPAWRDGKEPQGNFNAICRVPGFGIMTKDEFHQIAAKSELPDIPDYLFRDSIDFSSGAHKIIFCREDLREGFSKERRMQEPVSSLLHKRSFVPQKMLNNQIRRILSAMDSNHDFQVAIVPKIAFERFSMELVCWENSVSVGWLQDMSESVFADDAATSGAFHGSLDYLWSKLLAGWRDQARVRTQLRKWLSGRDLNGSLKDSTTVKNWDCMP